MKKVIRYSSLFIFALILAYIIHYAWVSFPIISGFDAKEMCSCLFVSGRDKQDIETSEFADFPYNLASFNINTEDSSVTCTIWGMAKRKAIYRRGIGCTLISGISEQELRSQVFHIPPPPALFTDTISWPYGDKVGDTFVEGVNKDRLKFFVDKAFEEPYKDKKVRTRAVLIVYKGQLVAEKYAKGFDKNTKMYGWSVAKSITAAIIGTLVKDGKIDITKPAPVAEWRNINDNRHAITVENLLQQTSGLNFEENYTKASDVTNMLYKTENMAEFTATHNLAHSPGTVFSYSSGNTNILSQIIRQTVEEDYPDYPFTALFYKIGMYHTLMEPDASGTYVGSSYIMATVRDFARFGLLYYNDGIWNNERILPEGWVKKTVTAPSANKSKNYGFQFWLNGIEKEGSSKHIYPDVPTDMFYCDGFAGQGIYIIPSKKLVVVRLGLTLDKSFDENEFLKNIIGTLK